ncbi:MAG TPA: chain length determinant protein EpsF [Burkholderiaceae bacterium]|jgi:chain length determinant protein EpsF|nr:chain length determinant protein EpsF [Burkholderiaceae bacterium]
MNFTQIALILRARLKIIVLILGVTVVTTLVVSLLIPKTYKASATLVLNYKGVDPISGFVLPAQLMPGYMATQTGIIKSQSVALKVVDTLKLTEGEEIREDFLSSTKGKGDIREWQAARLLKKLEVLPSRDSSVLDITFSAPDPQQAAMTANAFANAYQQVSTRLKVEPSKNAAFYFDEQIKRLLSKFEQAQKNVSAYKQQHGIVDDANRYDAEWERLNDLTRQLVDVQARTIEAASRRTQANGGALDSPDIIANPLIQNLKIQLAQAELRFAGISQKFTQSHPFYQQAEAQIKDLRASLDTQIRLAANSVSNNARIMERREEDLRAAVEKQKLKMIELNRKRDELKVLTSEMESARQAYETATQRFMKTSFEGQSTQSDISVLNPATPPIIAASPKVRLNTLLALFLGTLLGAIFALVAEILDRRVRSAEDLVNGFHAPLLGVMTWSEESRKRRPALARLLSPVRLLTN